ncbi:hypothetical protein [Acinetobacter baylyi]|uniref:hypothetical protein n=1 Tax=Acinetobacter baylyi TaxID=202950 RepID=UPI0013D86457|nr:hypothetical protein [Acinetobacter baylyi]
MISVGDAETYLINFYWNDDGSGYTYFRGSCIYGGNSGMYNPNSGSTQLIIPGGGSYGEQCYINLNGSSQHTAPPYFYVYWFGRAGWNNAIPQAAAYMTVYKLQS